MQLVSLAMPASHDARSNRASLSATENVRFADLSGDGVPDAVITIERRAFDLTERGELSVIEEVTYVVSGIGIDGSPTDEYSRFRLVRVGDGADG